MLLIAIRGLGGEGEQAELLDVEPFWDKRALRSTKLAVAVLEYILQRQPVLCISAQGKLQVLSSFHPTKDGHSCFILRSWIGKCWPKNTGLGQVWMERKITLELFSCLLFWKIVCKSFLSMCCQATAPRNPLLSWIKGKNPSRTSCTHTHAGRRGRRRWERELLVFRLK